MRSIRERMANIGFNEFQTPIITASSPEGARDFLVPSRLHPGKFYALPQAPQQFKQLIMVAGFDKYFQIAPCFRDEDPRADRSPTDFYQLDMEMSFVEQQDIFDTIEPVIKGVFEEYGKGRHPAGLNLGDCCSYALARASGEPLLCKGNDFARTDIPLVEVARGA